MKVFGVLMLVSAPFLIASANERKLFFARQDFLFSNGAADVLVGDFNNDGKRDALLLDNGANVGLLAENARGQISLGPLVQLAPRGELQVANGIAGDFNNDGNTDIAFIGDTGSDSEVDVALGNGDGTFRPLLRIPLLHGLDSLNRIAAGDVNRDGNLDLVLTSNLGIYVLLGDGVGGFDEPAQYSVGLTGAIAITDINEDGLADLVVSTTTGFGVLLNTGHGIFSAPIITPVASQVFKLAVGDVNRDGLADVVVIPGTHVFLGNGDGTFTKSFSGGFNGTGSIQIGDLNNDGNPDIVTAGGDYAVFVSYGDGQGHFSRSYAYPTAFDSEVGALVNLSGKAALDIVTANGLGGSASVLPNLGKERFQEAPAIAAAFPGPLVRGDFNGDGFDDLLVLGYSSVQTLFGTGTLFRAGPQTALPQAEFQVSAVAAADLNKDGRLDTAVVLGDASIQILLGNGDGTFTLGERLLNSRATSAIAGDFNGDGNLDLATDGQTVYFGNGGGTFQPALSIGPGATGIAVADLNHDGYDDIVTGVASARGQHYGTLNVFLGSKTGKFTGPSVVGPNNLHAIVAIGDMNGDGFPDVVASLDNSVHPLLVFLGNGDGTFRLNGNPQSPFGNLGSGPSVLGDFDGDGRLDIMTILPEGGSVGLMLGDGAGNISYSALVGAGQAPTFLVPGAFHKPGQNKLDVAVSNSDGTVSLLIHKPY